MPSQRKPKLPANPPVALTTPREAGGGKSHQPKRKKKEEEEARQSDAKVSALLDETSSSGSPPASGLTAVERMDRIVNHAHDELDLLLLDAQAKDTAKASFPTEQRLKQKARAKAGHIAKKKPQVVEDHHDDCGEDFSPLGDDPYFQDALEGMTNSDEVNLPSWDFGMNGSEHTPEAPAEHGVTSQQMVFHSLESFNAWN